MQPENYVHTNYSWDETLLDSLIEAVHAFMTQDENRTYDRYQVREHPCAN